METEMKQLFAKIHAIATINKEIIQRIRNDPSMLSFQGKLKDRTHLVVDHMATQREFFGWWRWDGKLVAVRDTFKDKVDYAKCNTFEDLALLNKKLVGYAEQYRAFEDSAFALTELRQYLTNYELIQTALGQLDAQYQANAARSKNQNRTRQVREATREFNTALGKLSRLRIHLADVQGRPLFKITLSGQHAKQEICGIAATKEGKLLVVFREAHGRSYAAIYSDSGELVKQEGLYSGLNKPALDLYGVAVDWATGNLVLADQGSNQVAVVNTTWFLSSPPPKIRELSKPVGVAVGEGGLIYVTQRHRRDITVLRAGASQFERTIEQATPLQRNEDDMKKRAAGRGLCGIAVHPTTGNIYAADPDHDRVLIFTREGDFEGSFHLGEGHSDPTGLTIDPKGNVFVTEQENHRVLVFHSHGGAPVVLGGGPEASLELIRSPVAVAVIGDRVFVANKDKTIHAFAFIH